MATQDNTDKVLNEVDKLIRQKLELAALMVEGTAKLPGYCPRKTGTSARSITHEMAPDGKSVKVGSNVEYFPYHEMGTVKMRAHASLRRALVDNKKRIERLFEAR